MEKEMNKTIDQQDRIKLKRVLRNEVCDTCFFDSRLYVNECEAPYLNSDDDPFRAKCPEGRHCLRWRKK